MIEDGTPIKLYSCHVCRSLVASTQEAARVACCGWIMARCADARFFSAVSDAVKRQRCTRCAEWTPDRHMNGGLCSDCRYPDDPPIESIATTPKGYPLRTGEGRD